MEKIFTTGKSCLKFAEVDIYKEGCQPETGVSHECDIEFKAESPSQLIEKIKEFFEVDDDALLLNSCDEIGRIDVQVLENGEGYKASQSEMKEWKIKGCIKLWACTYSFMVNQLLIEAVNLDAVKV